MPNVDRQAQRRLRAVADGAAPDVRAKALQALVALRDAVSAAQLERALRTRDAFAIHDLAGTLPRRLQPAVTVLQRVFQSGAQAGRAVLPQGVRVKTSFAGANPHAAAAARRQAAQFVTGVTDETRRAIRAVVARSFTEGIPPREAAQLIKPLIGLTQQQAVAVAARRTALVADGMSAARAAVTVKGYAHRLLGQRAETIARTEVIRAASAGQVAAWEESIAAGRLSPRAQKVWIVTDDDRLAIVGCRTAVATIDGYVPIKDVQVGDRALTHADRFCEVTRREVKQYSGPTVRIDCHLKGFKPLQVTYGHPILVHRDGHDAWILAEHMLSTDDVYVAARPCVDCGKLLPHGPYAESSVRICATCTVARINAERWAKPDEHARVREWNAARWAVPGARDAQRKRFSGKANPAARADVRAKIRDRAFERFMDPAQRAAQTAHNRRTALLPSHPFNRQTPEERDAVRVLAHKARGRKARGGSYLERKMAWFLEKQGIAFEPQWTFRVGDRQCHADFFLTGPRVVIECDGPHHSDPLVAARDAQKDAALREQGVEILRFDNTTIRDRFADVADAVQAYCCFVRVRPEIEHRRVHRQAVYHLTVSGDESYVAGGVSVHNCPICAPLDGETAPVANGTFSTRLGKVGAPPVHPRCRCAIGVEPGPVGLAVGRERRAAAAPHDSLTTHQRADGTWTPRRAQLHARIVTKALKGVPASAVPTVYMTGGGPASGKSTMLNSGKVTVPPAGRAVHVDPDAIKAQLPEYVAKTKAGDATAAAFVHEESSHVAKRLASETAAAGKDIVLDTTGDGTVEALQQRIADLRTRGAARVVANYASNDTDLAVEFANLRGQKTGRFVPETYIRETHRQVSITLPQAVERGLFDEVSLWDTNASGRPRLVMTGGRHLPTVIHDAALWQDFLRKGR